MTEHPQDGGDPQGCAACGATLLAKKDYRRAEVWIRCSGGCGEFELGPSIVKAVYPDVAAKREEG